jgi:hypothetical protein
MVLTRNVVFGLEPNNSAATSQPLAGAAGALGYVEPPPAITAADSGWYNSTGLHDPFNGNYLVGLPPDAPGQYRNWFVFDVPAVSGSITSARLELFNPSGGYSSVDGSETYTLFDVSTPIGTLTAGGSGLTGIYDDIGTGVSYGSVTVTSASNGQLVVVNLNAAGIAALTAAQGGQIAIGGALTSLSGSAAQYLFGFTNGTLVRQLVISTSEPPSDWYSVKLAGDQTALQVETRTPGDGPGELRNTLNPRIAVYDATGTTLIATGTALADGRNEKIVITGLAPGGTYQVRIIAEGGTFGEYFLTATPLRVPAVTTKVDDQLPNSAGPDGEFHVTNPAMNGWTSVSGAGWQNDYSVHAFGVNHTPNNVATWKIHATSSTPELFVTWVPRPTNATNATYQVFRANTLLATVVVNQRELPNDGLLFGNTYVESLGKFSGIPVNSMLTVVLLTVGANGDVVADAVFDPPTDPDRPDGAAALGAGAPVAAERTSPDEEAPTVAVQPVSLPWFAPDELRQGIPVEVQPTSRPPVGLGPDAVPLPAGDRPSDDSQSGLGVVPSWFDHARVEEIGLPSGIDLDEDGL